MGDNGASACHSGISIYSERGMRRDTAPGMDNWHSNATVEDVGKSICGDRYSIKRVTKIKNNGKDMSADVVLVRNKQ